MQRTGAEQEATPHRGDDWSVCSSEQQHPNLGCKQDCEIWKKKKKVMLIIFQDGWSAKSRDTRSITTTKQARKGSITNILSL